MMRAERSAALLEHDRTPLVVRGSLPRTFMTLGIFVELSLLFCGLYMLWEALVRPLEANGTAVVGGGVMLALASVLLFYMVRPRRNEILARREAVSVEERQFREKVLTAYGEALHARIEAERVLEEEDELPGPM